MQGRVLLATVFCGNGEVWGGTADLLSHTHTFAELTSRHPIQPNEFLSWDTYLHFDTKWDSCPKWVLLVIGYLDSAFDIDGRGW